MPGGRRYYDPELQVDRLIEGEKDLSRIELFPVGQESTARLPDDHGKWVARKIESDGSISGYTPGDFNHATALAQAEQVWPGLQVFELRSEIEDSTWEGVGPSPRIWQNAAPVMQLPQQPEQLFPDGPQPGDPPPLRTMYAPEAAHYVNLGDLAALLEHYAKEFDEQRNPSAAVALREVAAALLEAF